MGKLNYVLHPSLIVEKGRRMAISGVLFLAAGAFFFASIIMASIELGNQIASGTGFERSGLWISALILFSIGVLSAGTGRLITVRHSDEKERQSDEQVNRIPVMPI